MNWIDGLISSYYDFLKEKTIVTPSKNTDWITITTPFFGIYNDAYEIFVKKNKDNLILSDDGKTLENLEMMGALVSRSPKRKEIFDSILLNYGIKQNNNELITEANEKTFPQKKLNLLSAMIEINDLYVLSKNTIASLFREEVQKYLESQELIYTPHFISKGSTGLEFTFDFQIAYHKKEIVIKAFNSVNKVNLPQFLFTWEDIKPVRERMTGKTVSGIAIINNEEKEIQDDFLDAFRSKGADYILWTERYSPTNLEKLKAA